MGTPQEWQFPRVVDAPGGGGKIPVMPQYLVSVSDKRVALRNYEGVVATYSQPVHPYSECWCELCKADKYGATDGVARLLSGKKKVIEPSGLKRNTRRSNGD